MTTTAAKIWLDGALVVTNAATAPLMGHALQRGSLVFDVAAFHRTARGPAIFRATDHVARFLRSARIVGLPLAPAFDAEALLQAATLGIAESGLEEGLVRWSLFYAAREPDLLPRDERTHVAVAAQALEDTGERAPIAVAVFEDARKAAPDVLPPDAKAAAAYLGPMLARRRAIAGGADEIVLLDRDGNIAEAPVSNVFAVVGGSRPSSATLWTPPLGTILPGITRQTVIALARAEGIVVREERLPRAAFEAADEAFLSGTSLPLAPIRRINQRTLSPEAPGPITRLLRERISLAQRGTLPEAQGGRADWLTYARPGVLANG